MLGKSPFYRGRVLAHSDMGRCKIFWYGVTPDEYHDPEKAEELPDSEPAMPLFGSGKNGNGVFSYPDLNTIVWGFFANDDPNTPVFFASTLLAEENADNFQEITSYSTKANNEKVIKLDDVTIKINSTYGTLSLIVQNAPKTKFASIILKNNGDISIYGDGTLKINAQNIEMTANGGHFHATSTNDMKLESLDKEAIVGGTQAIVQASQGSAILWDSKEGHGISTTDYIS